MLTDNGRLVPEIPDASLPPPFPETAKANGVPGPNACVLIHDAIFPQGDHAAN